MTLHFMDGFDHYATADILKKWTTAGNVSISSTGGRRGGGALQSGTNTGITKTLAVAPSSFVVGFALFWPSVTARLIGFRDGSTWQCEMEVGNDGTLAITRNAAAISGARSTATLVPNAWNYIEWKVTIADSIAANSCKIKVNGADFFTAPAGIDVKNSANATANVFAIHPGGNTFIYDDVYLCDQSGTTNNDFLGDCRIDTLFPTSDGNYSQFTPSTGTAHWSLVDEATPNTTDYVSSSTAGQRDSYGFGDLPALASTTVFGVQALAAVLKSDAGSRSAAVMCRSGSTDADGAALALSTSQTYASAIWETNPATGAAWTDSAVNAAEFGVKVAA